MEEVMNPIRSFRNWRLYNEPVRELNRLNTRQQRTIVMVVHDLHQAARYAHHVVAMHDGQVAAAGAPADVFTEDLIRRVFSLEARVLTDPVTGTPMVVPAHGPGGVR